MALTIEQIQTLITDKHDAREIINEMADYLQSNPSGGSSYLVAEVTLTDAQIKALPTIPVEIVAAQGAGKVINVINAIINSNFVTTAYGNVNVTELFLSLPTFTVYTIQKATLLTDTEPAIGFGNGVVGSAAEGGYEYVSTLANQPLTLVVTGNGGNFTGGNAANTLKVTVYCTIVNLQK